MHLEGSHKCRNQTPQLGFGKVAADAAPRPMQERRDRIVALRTTIVVRLAIFIDPSVWNELRCVLAPQLRRPVDSPRANDKLRSRWDECVVDCCWANGIPDGDWDRGIEAKSFIADGIEKRKRFQQLTKFDLGSWVGRNVVADLLTKTSLYIRMRRKEIGCPRKGRRCCFVTIGWLVKIKMGV